MAKHLGAVSAGSIYLDGSIIKGANTLTVPSISSDDVFCLNDTNQALTHKTLNGTCTVDDCKLANNRLYSSSNNAITFPSGSSYEVVGLDLGQTLSNKTFGTTCSATGALFTAGTFRTGGGTITMPDTASDTLACTTLLQELRNKTFTLPIIATITSSGASLTVPSATQVLVGTLGSSAMTGAVTGSQFSLDFGTTTVTAGDIDMSGMISMGRSRIADDGKRGIIQWKDPQGASTFWRSLLMTGSKMYAVYSNSEIPETTDPDLLVRENVLAGSLTTATANVTGDITTTSLLTNAGAATVSFPATSGALADTASTDPLTNKTITGATIATFYNSILHDNLITAPATTSILLGTTGSTGLSGTYTNAGNTLQLDYTNGRIGIGAASTNGLRVLDKSVSASSIYTKDESVTFMDTTAALSLGVFTGFATVDAGKVKGYNLRMLAGSRLSVSAVVSPSTLVDDVLTIRGGRLGIGTSDPQTTLHVVGSIKLTGSLNDSSFTYALPGKNCTLVTSGGSASLTGQYQSATLAFDFDTNSITATGSPSTRGTALSTTNMTMLASDLTTQTFVLQRVPVVSVGTGLSRGIFIGEDASLKTSYASGYAIRFDGSGGAASDGALLISKRTTSTGVAGYSDGLTMGYPTDGQLTNVMSITISGGYPAVGVGTIAPTSALDVVGNIVCEGAVNGATIMTPAAGATLSTTVRHTVGNLPVRPGVVCTNRTEDGGLTEWSPGIYGVTNTAPTPQTIVGNGTVILPVSGQKIILSTWSSPTISISCYKHENGVFTDYGSPWTATSTYWAPAGCCAGQHLFMYLWRSSANVCTWALIRANEDGSVTCVTTAALPTESVAPTSAAMCVARLPGSVMRGVFLYGECVGFVWTVDPTKNAVSIGSRQVIPNILALRSCIGMTSTTFVASFITTGINGNRCAVHTVTGDTISQGTPLNAFTTANDRPAPIARLSDTTFVISSTNGTSPVYGAVGTITGTDVSIGALLDITDGYTNMKVQYWMDTIDSRSVVWYGMQYSSSYVLYKCVLIATGTILSRDAGPANVGNGGSSSATLAQGSCIALSKGGDSLVSFRYTSGNTRLAYVRRPPLGYFHAASIMAPTQYVCELGVNPQIITIGGQSPHTGFVFQPGATSTTILRGSSTVATLPTPCTGACQLTSSAMFAVCSTNFYTISTSGTVTTSAHGISSLTEAHSMYLSDNLVLVYGIQSTNTAYVAVVHIDTDGVFTIIGSSTVALGGTASNPRAFMFNIGFGALFCCVGTTVVSVTVGISSVYAVTLGAATSRISDGVTKVRMELAKCGLNSFIVGLSQGNGVYAYVGAISGSAVTVGATPVVLTSTVPLHNSLSVVALDDGGFIMQYETSTSVTLVTGQLYGSTLYVSPNVVTTAEVPGAYGTCMSTETLIVPPYNYPLAIDDQPIAGIALDFAYPGEQCRVARLGESFVDAYTDNLMYYLEPSGRFSTSLMQPASYTVWAHSAGTPTLTSSANVATVAIAIPQTSAAVLASRPVVQPTPITTTIPQTLTNMTFTSPTISSIVNTGVLTLPTASQTLLGTAGFATLTCIFSNASNALQFDFGNARTSIGTTPDPLYSLTTLSKNIVTDTFYSSGGSICSFGTAASKGVVVKFTDTQFTAGDTCGIVVRATTGTNSRLSIAGDIAQASDETYPSVIGNDIVTVATAPTSASAYLGIFNEYPGLPISVNGNVYATKFQLDTTTTPSVKPSLMSPIGDTDQTPVIETSVVHNSSFVHAGVLAEAGGPANNALVDVVRNRTYLVPPPSNEYMLSPLAASTTFIEKISATRLITFEKYTPVRVSTMDVTATDVISKTSTMTLTGAIPDTTSLVSSVLIAANRVVATWPAAGTWIWEYLTLDAGGVVTEATYATSGSTVYGAVVLRLSDNQGVFITSTSTTALVLSLFTTAAGLSVDSSQTVTVTNGYIQAACAFSATAIAVVITNGTAYETHILTLSGSTWTFGAAYTLTSGIAGSNISIIALDASRFALTYYITSIHRIIAGSFVGTAITYGTAVVFDSGIVADMAACELALLTADKIVAWYVRSSSRSYHYAVFTVSTITITRQPLHSKGMYLYGVPSGTQSSNVRILSDWRFACTYMNMRNQPIFKVVNLINELDNDTSMLPSQFVTTMTSVMAACPGPNSIVIYTYITAAYGLVTNVKIGSNGRPYAAAVYEINASSTAGFVWQIARFAQDEILIPMIISTTIRFSYFKITESPSAVTLLNAQNVVTSGGNHPSACALANRTALVACMYSTSINAWVITGDGATLTIPAVNFGKPTGMANVSQVRWLTALTPTKVMADILCSDTSNWKLAICTISGTTVTWYDYLETDITSANAIRMEALTDSLVVLVGSTNTYAIARLYSVSGTTISLVTELTTFAADRCVQSYVQRLSDNTAFFAQCTYANRDYKTGTLIVTGGNTLSIHPDKWKGLYGYAGTVSWFYAPMTGAADRMLGLAEMPWSQPIAAFNRVVVSTTYDIIEAQAVRPDYVVQTPLTIGTSAALTYPRVVVVDAHLVVACYMTTTKEVFLISVNTDTMTVISTLSLGIAASSYPQFIKYLGYRRILVIVTQLATSVRVDRTGVLSVVTTGAVANVQHTIVVVSSDKTQSLCLCNCSTNAVSIIVTNTTMTIGSYYPIGITSGYVYCTALLEPGKIAIMESVSPMYTVLIWRYSLDSTGLVITTLEAGTPYTLQNAVGYMAAIYRISATRFVTALYDSLASPFQGSISIGDVVGTDITMGPCHTADTAATGVTRSVCTIDETHILVVSQVFYTPYVSCVEIFDVSNGSKGCPIPILSYKIDGCASSASIPYNVEILSSSGEAVIVGLTGANMQIQKILINKPEAPRTSPIDSIGQLTTAVTASSSLTYRWSGYASDPGTTWCVAYANAANNATVIMPLTYVSQGQVREGTSLSIAEMHMAIAPMEDKIFCFGATTVRILDQRGGVVTQISSDAHGLTNVSDVSVFPVAQGITIAIMIQDTTVTAICCDNTPSVLSVAFVVPTAMSCVRAAPVGNNTWAAMWIDGALIEYAVFTVSSSYVVTASVIRTLITDVAATTQLDVCGVKDGAVMARIRYNATLGKDVALTVLRFDGTYLHPTNYVISRVPPYGSGVSIVSAAGGGAGAASGKFFVGYLTDTADTGGATWTLHVRQGQVIKTEVGWGPEFTPNPVGMAAGPLLLTALDDMTASVFSANTHSVLKERGFSRVKGITDICTTDASCSMEASTATIANVGSTHASLYVNGQYFVNDSGIPTASPTISIGIAGISPTTGRLSIQPTYVPSAGAATLALRGQSHDYVDTTSIETLTNKTFTTPIISSWYQDTAHTNLITLPTLSSDTLVGVSLSQTLTNKILSACTISGSTYASTTFSGMNIGTNYGSYADVVLDVAHTLRVSAVVADGTYTLNPKTKSLTSAGAGYYGMPVGSVITTDGTEFVPFGKGTFAQVTEATATTVTLEAVASQKICTCKMAANSYIVVSCTTAGALNAFHLGVDGGVVTTLSTLALGGAGTCETLGQRRIFVRRLSPTKAVLSYYGGAIFMQVLVLTANILSAGIAYNITSATDERSTCVAMSETTAVLLNYYSLTVIPYVVTVSGTVLSATASTELDSGSVQDVMDSCRVSDTSACISYMHDSEGSKLVMFTLAASTVTWYSAGMWASADVGESIYFISTLSNELMGVHTTSDYNTVTAMRWSISPTYVITASAGSTIVSANVKSTGVCSFGRSKITIGTCLASGTVQINSLQYSGGWSAYYAGSQPSAQTQTSDYGEQCVVCEQISPYGDALFVTRNASGHPVAWVKKIICTGVTDSIRNVSIDTAPVGIGSTYPSTAVAMRNGSIICSSNAKHFLCRYTDGKIFASNYVASHADDTANVMCVPVDDNNAGVVWFDTNLKIGRINVNRQSISISTTTTTASTDSIFSVGESNGQGRMTVIHKPTSGDASLSDQCTDVTSETTPYAVTTGTGTINRILRMAPNVSVFVKAVAGIVVGFYVIQGVSNTFASLSATYDTVHGRIPIVSTEPGSFVMLGNDNANFLLYLCYINGTTPTRISQNTLPYAILNDVNSATYDMCSIGCGKVMVVSTTTVSTMTIAICSVWFTGSTAGYTCTGYVEVSGNFKFGSICRLPDSPDGNPRVLVYLPSDLQVRVYEIGNDTLGYCDNCANPDISVQYARPIIRCRGDIIDGAYIGGRVYGLTPSGIPVSSPLTSGDYRNFVVSNRVFGTSPCDGKLILDA